MRRLAVLVIFLGLMAACTAQAAPAIVVATPSATPTASPTVTPAPSFTATPSPTPTPRPSPTPTPMPPAMSASDIFLQYSGSVVLITTQYGVGSGVTIEDGYVLTAAHVVEGVSTVKVMIPYLGTVQAKVVGSDSVKDIAWLQFERTFGFTRLPPLTKQSVVPGSDVVVLGFPRGLGDVPTVTKGIVSAFRMVGGIPEVQVDAPINPGNSGGPVFDSMGRIIGIVSWKCSNSDGLGFAISSEAVMEILPALRAGGFNRGQPSSLPSYCRVAEVTSPSGSLP